MAAVAAAQAEFMEKQKHIFELQEKVQSMKGSISRMANTEGALLMEKKRCVITNSELAKLAPEHNVYRALGRAFIKMPVEDLTKSTTDREAKCQEEATRLAAEKKRIGDAMVAEEAQLQTSMNEFVAALQLLQSQTQNQATMKK